MLFGLLLLLLLLYTFSFSWFKGIKLKEKSKTKKTGVPIRPSLAGYGLGTRIRATLARILIPGPATDPHLRICGPGACLKARTTGLYGLFLWTNGLFLDLNFTLKRYARWRILKRGNCVKSLKQEKLSVWPFKLRSSFYTSRVGDRRPQFAVWRVGVSWQIVTEPL